MILMHGEKNILINLVRIPGGDKDVSRKLDLNSTQSLYFIINLVNNNTDINRQTFYNYQYFSIIFISKTDNKTSVQPTKTCPKTTYDYQLFIKKLSAIFR